MYPLSPYGGYPVPNFYSVNANGGFAGGYPVLMNGGGSGAVPVVDNVLAPLDVKVEQEKKAEKRKIADINFDTFV